VDLHHDVRCSRRYSILQDFGVKLAMSHLNTTRWNTHIVVLADGELHHRQEEAFETDVVDMKVLSGAVYFGIPVAEPISKGAVLGGLDIAPTSNPTLTPPHLGNTNDSMSLVFSFES
jgi:hypothetical protein